MGVLLCISHLHYLSIWPSWYRRLKLEFKATDLGLIHHPGHHLDKDIKKRYPPCHWPCYSVTDSMKNVVFRKTLAASQSSSTTQVPNYLWELELKPWWVWNDRSICSISDPGEVLYYPIYTNACQLSIKLYTLAK